MANNQKREIARNFRTDGKSIGWISLKLNVSKSTVSYWCRDILLTETQMKKLYDAAKSITLKALLIASEKKRQTRIKNTIDFGNFGKKDVGKLSKRDIFMLGLGLYWGEGYKSGNDEFGFTNSDPKMITFIIRWLEEIYQIDKDKFVCRISINNIHTKREEEIIKYWSLLTGLNYSQFTKTSFIKAKSKKVYTNGDNYFGVLRVKVRNGTNLRRRILGSLTEIKN